MAIHGENNMNYKDLDIKRSYKSCGENKIANDFLIPVLKLTKRYKRSVGFFSSSVITTVIDGIVSIARNGGTIQLIASPMLSADDVHAIELGYQLKETIVSNAFTEDFRRAVYELDDSALKLLAELIARGILDIRIAVTNSSGCYHDKLGILEDFDGNKIAFYGSANSSENGYKINYEKIRVVRGWIDGEKECVYDETNEFDLLWSGHNPFVEVYSYKKSAYENIINVIQHHQNRKNTSNEPIKLRDYQEKAIRAWVQNSYHGFYVMATGTGKTWTAIFSAKELQKEHEVMVVICAPYKHLVKQWSEDVQKAYPNGKIILVSSENPSWEIQLKQEIIRQRYDAKRQLIVISTIASFKMSRFEQALKTSSQQKLLIVDEAHRFTNRPDSIREQYQYMLGLSATPFSGTNAKKGRELMDFFGGEVFHLPIDEALKRGYLVSYYYKPIFVYANEKEEGLFKYYSQKILSCFKDNVCINPDLLVKSLRSRLRVISMVEEKQTRINEILSYVEERDHFVVYCGDGRLFDSDLGEEIRHIQSIKRVLTKADYKSSQFTAQEDMNTRMQLVDAFNKGEISALAAIRCLDEGINIPSIKSALILSSNDDYREFVQRRGRILRTYKDKKYATIYDVVVLPSSESVGWAKIELRRFLEYARLSLNWSDLKLELNRLLEQYGLSIEEIDVYDYEGMDDTYE